MPVTPRLGLHQPTGDSDAVGSIFTANYILDLQAIDDLVQKADPDSEDEIPVFDGDGYLVGSGVTLADLQGGLLDILTDHGMLLYRGADTLAALSPDTAGKSLITQGAEANPIFGYPSHGTLLNLTLDHHPQYIKHDLATAASDFLVASGVGVFVKKTLSETRAILGVDVARPIEVSFDGSGAAIAANSMIRFVVEYPCTIVKWTVIAHTTGAIQFDIRKCTYAQFDDGATHPVAGDSIVASDKPKITASGVKNTGSALTGWTKSISKGDILEFVVESCTAITQATISLEVSTP